MAAVPKQMVMPASRKSSLFLVLATRRMIGGRNRIPSQPIISGPDHTKYSRFGGYNNAL